MELEINLSSPMGGSLQFSQSKGGNKHRTDEIQGLVLGCVSTYSWFYYCLCSIFKGISVTLDQ